MIISIGTGLIITPLILYIITFYGQSISKDPANWGQFGDYVGGVLNPIIAVMNLIVLIFISIYLSKLDSHRHFNEYRFNAYREVCLKLDESDRTSESLTNLAYYLENFQFYNQFLFRNRKKSFNLKAILLIEKTKRLSELQLEEQKNIVASVPWPEHLGKELTEALKKFPLVDDEHSVAIKEFEEAKQIFLISLQISMIGKHSLNHWGE